MSEKESVARKIRKLLALSEKNPNKNEAAAAAAKARAMLIEHRLTMEDLGEDPGCIMEQAWQTWPGRTPDNYVGQLVSVIAQACMCKVLVGMAETTHSWMLIGRKDNIEAAIAQLDYMYLAMENKLVFAGAGRGRAWRNDFRLGWAWGIHEAVTASKAPQASPEGEARGAQEQGLMVREDAALAEYLANKAYGSRRPPQPRTMNGEAVMAGFDSGMEAQQAKVAKKLEN